MGLSRDFMNTIFINSARDMSNSNMFAGEPDVTRDTSDTISTTVDGTSLDSNYRTSVLEPETANNIGSENNNIRKNIKITTKNGDKSQGCGNLKSSSLPARIEQRASVIERLNIHALERLNQLYDGRRESSEVDGTSSCCFWKQRYKTDPYSLSFDPNTILGVNGPCSLPTSEDKSEALEEDFVKNSLDTPAPVLSPRRMEFLPKYRTELHKEMYRISNSVILEEKEEVSYQSCNSQSHSETDVNLPDLGINLKKQRKISDDMFIPCRDARYNNEPVYSKENKTDFSFRQLSSCSCSEISFMSQSATEISDLDADSRRGSKTSVFRRRSCEHIRSEVVSLSSLTQVLTSE